MHRGKSICKLLALACSLALASRANADNTAQQAITLAGNRLVLDQTAFFNWPGEADYTGTIAAGLGNGYLITGTPSYQTATQNAGNYIIGTAGGNFLGDEAWGLATASQISALPMSNTYRAAINNFYIVSVPGSPGGTSGYIGRLVDSYSNSNSFHEQSQAVFYLAEHTAAAAYVNAPSLATWRSSLISTLAQVDDNDLFPTLAAGAALWALAKSGPLDNTLISSSGFWAGKTLADLPGIVASRQVTSGPDAGSFYGNLADTTYVGYTMDAAYAVLGLAAANPAVYGTQALAGKAWLAQGVYTSGPNIGRYTDAPSAPTVIQYAYSGQAMQAMAASFGVTWDGTVNNWSSGPHWSILQAPNNNSPLNAYYDVTINGGNVNLDTNIGINTLNLAGGTLQGTSNMTLSGGTINGVYNVTGVTTLLAGTLQVGTGGATGTMVGGTLVNNGAVVINRTGTPTITTGISGTGDLSHVGTGTTTLSGPYSATGAMAVTAGKLAFGNTNAVRQSSGVLVTASSLSVAGGTTLDLGNRDMLIHTGSSAAFEAQIGNAYDFGSFDLPGIASSTAALTPGTILGINSGDDYNSFSPNSGTFDGSPVVNTDTVIKYTYAGDLNLDGVVDDNDLFQFLGSYLGTQTGNYAFGDLTFDGLVNDDDLLPFLGAYLVPPTQPLGTIEAGALNSPSNVPEPASLSLLGLGAIGMLARRKRGN